MVRKLLGRLSGLVTTALNDSLLRNAAFLMASTGIMSVLGFGFWIFVAHLYSPSEIGEASALIAITLLISNLSFFGLNSAFVRFLPTSKNQSRDINAALITVTLATVIAGAAYLAFGPHYSGHLAVLLSSWWTRGLFLLMMVAVSLNTLTDSIFIANRRAEYHTIVYSAFGVVRLILPLILIMLGSLGIFMAYISAVCVSLLLSFYFMKKAAGYVFFSRPNWNFIIDSRRYTSSNYISTLLSGLPSQLIPTLIILKLGAASAAYFSMAWTMANLLYVVPSAITNSLLAETSHKMANQARNLRHAIRLLASILVPIVGLAILVAPYLLSLFGKNYAAGGTGIFQLLALSTFFIAGSSIGNTILNLDQRGGGLVGIQVVLAGSTLLLAYLLIPMGLIGIGAAMLAGNILGFGAQLLLLARHRRQARVQLLRSQSGPQLDVLDEALRNYTFGSFSLGPNMGSGDRSSVNLITTRKGKYIVKMYRSDKRCLNDLAAEISFTKSLSGIGVPTPTVITTKTGESLVTVQRGAELWIGVITRFEHGVIQSTLGLKEVENMAKIQALIHSHGIEFSSSETAAFVRERPQLIWSKLAFLGPRGVSHFDFDGTNILFDAAGNVVCVLDFEGIRRDFLIICILFTLLRLTSERSGTGLIKRYLRAYQEIRPLGRVEKACIRFALAAKAGSVRLLVLPY
jgi:O-antigen/teichoic acid export membrane protein/Ser/Thr protein kinase RdoA (MazF antagonist)